MEPPVITSMLVILAYFVGSVSSAIVVCKLLELPDPRTEGSQNPGATNVLRIAGKKEAAAVLLFDVLKGFLFVFIGSIYALPANMLAVIGLSATLGHMFPIYYRFKGGKGVATFLGVMFGLHFLLGVVCAAIWLAMLRLTHYSSASSLTMVLAAPFMAIIFTNNFLTFIPLLLLTVVIYVKHRANIGRLIDGKESKTEFKGLKHLDDDNKENMEKLDNHSE